MKRLGLGILKDYEIEYNRPDRLAFVQFGDDPMLLGLADRLIDDANRLGANLGVAVVSPGDAGYARELKEQDGLFTVFVRGEKGEARVHREQVVQCVLQALDPARDEAALQALCENGNIRCALLHGDPIGEYAARDRLCEALALRFLSGRWKAGLPAPRVVLLCEDRDESAELRARWLALARQWRAGDAFEAWLGGMEIVPALSDALTFRCGAEEAARLCTEMNYADAMIHYTEPLARLTVQAGADAGRCAAAANVEGLEWTDDLAPHFLYKTRIFDAGMFALAAAGRLRGCRTLAECVRDEALRELAGRAMMDEILPALDAERAELAAYVERCYERYGNPMNDNRLEDAARGLAHRFCIGALPAVRAYAAEHFAAPPSLTVALAAMVLLLADTRPEDGGWKTVVDGEKIPVHESPRALEAFSKLSSDMDPESLAYAVLADRDLWHGEDLRDIDGLAEALAANLAG